MKLRMKMIFAVVGSEKMNDKDTIYRRVAIDALNREYLSGATVNMCGLEVAMDVIEELPSAGPTAVLCNELRISSLPEIIRCRDCVYSHMTYNTYSGECKYCDKWGEMYESGESLYLEVDFFCGFGERKTDGYD